MAAIFANSEQNLDFLLDTARDYGPLASFRVGPTTRVLASGLTLLRVGLGTSPIRSRAS